MQANTILIPNEYFLKMAKQDYSKWDYALAREFFQNSIDAGAKNINVSFEYSEEESCNIVTVSDDGCGMSKDVLLNSLLVLGGSYKECGSVGAFGKAKELLYFSWNKYSIRTRDNYVSGFASQYEIEKTNDYLKGTVSKIFIDNKESIEDIIQAFKFIAMKMHVPVNIVVDGETYKPLFRKGTLKKDCGWCKIYQNKSNEDIYANFNINGIWMFERFIGSGHGLITIEMNNDSIGYLTSNRDSMKSEFLTEAENMISELAINSSSFLKNNKDSKLEVIFGNGEINLSEFKAKPKHKVQDAALKAVREEQSAHNKDVNINDVIKGGLSHEIKTEIDFMGSANQFIGYDPDFALRYNGKKSFKIKKFMQTAKALTLAKIWTETVKQVLMDNDLYVNFTSGFTFLEHTMASNLISCGRLNFLLNPFLIGSDIGEKHIMSNRKMLIKSLKSLACHEVAHCYEKCHNERFVSIEAQVRAKTWKNEKIYRKISKIGV